MASCLLDSEGAAQSAPRPCRQAGQRPSPTLACSVTSSLKWLTVRLQALSSRKGFQTAAWKPGVSLPSRSPTFTLGTVPRTQACPG